MYEAPYVKFYRVVQIEERFGRFYETTMKEGLTYWEARRYKKRIAKVSPRMERVLYIEKYWV